MINVEMGLAAPCYRVICNAGDVRDTDEWFIALPFTYDTHGARIHVRAEVVGDIPPKDFPSWFDCPWAAIDAFHSSAQQSLLRATEGLHKVWDKRNVPYVEAGGEDEH